MPSERRFSSLEPCRGIRARLTKRFLSFAADADRYGRRVDKECGRFPEGDLFPFVFPAVGLCILVATGRAPADQTLPAARMFLDLGAKTVVRRIGPITSIPSGTDEAVYLGWLCMGLVLWRLAGGDESLDAERRRLRDVLLADLRARRGAPMASYPGLYWPFDTIPVLLALSLCDRLDGTGACAAAIAEHIEWMKSTGLDPRLGLPVSQVDEACRPAAPPRGCEVSLRLSLLPLLDFSFARDQYRQYVRHYWRELGWVAGFREWPPGHDGGTDVDSGPILAGLGMAASGLGIGATAALGDRWRTWRLCSQVAVANGLLRAVAVGPEKRKRGWSGWVPTRFDRDAVTGFLFGDVCLFLALAVPLLGQVSPRDGVER